MRAFERVCSGMRSACSRSRGSPATKRRLASPHRSCRPYRHADRGCRRHLSSGVVQRPFAARVEGDDERGRAACAQSPSQRRHLQKAARGELRRGLPVGFVWGEADGEVLPHPDEAVVTAIRTIFARFAETGSARRVWLWFRTQGLQLPLQDEHTCRDPLGRGELPRHPPGLEQSRLCGSLRLWQDANGDGA